MGHLAAQIRGDGPVPGWFLIIGAACFLCGLILTLLFMILIRLHRIEQHIMGSDSLRSERDATQTELENLSAVGQKGPPWVENGPFWIGQSSPP